MLKGERCFGAKCAMTRRPYHPGQQGPNSRTKLSEYGRQLREKQKLKRIYGLSEASLRRFFDMADKSSASTSDILLQLIESRVDNLVYRAGVGASRSDSRQIVSHGHVKVDGVKLDVPSAQVKPGQIIEIDNKLKIDIKKTKSSPWLKKDEKKRSFELLHLPNKEEIDLNINEKLVVEFYSR